MKKLDSKGFMLTETLIASTLLITVLLIMYVQFKNIFRNYEKSFKYNTVNDIYSLYNVKKYIEQENYVSMAGRLDINKYVDLTTCNSFYYKNVSYCEQLYSNLGIKKLYLTNENTQTLREKNDLPKDISEFIKTIKNTTGSGYRLVAKFEGDRYATLKVFSGSNYKADISQSCNTANKLKYKINHKNLDTNEDVKEPEILEASCGSIINVEGLKDETNQCIFAASFSSPFLNITTDESTNSATILYKKYQSTLTLRYVEQGTNISVYPSKTINVNCGDVIDIDKYIYPIENRNFIRSTKDRVTVSNENVTVDLIYTIEGGIVHE